MSSDRGEVDGLRALIVVPVILFHAGVPGLVGGFVGVDVFLVISGSLIASIIYDEILEQRFSMVTFLERRARRIIPALYAVLLVPLPLGWFFLLPDNFENLGQSIVATVGVSNNILLWLTSGYWDLANEYKPLLHTWSLGVEEQFYLVFLLILLWPIPRGSLVFGNPSDHQGVTARICGISRSLSFCASCRPMSLEASRSFSRLERLQSSH